MESLLDLDILTADKSTICVLKVLVKIWENKHKMEAVANLADLLCKFTDEKRVFDDIEFYMLELAHLIIHLDQNSQTQGLEKLAMVIAQTSMHSALQLSFLFAAALEDYQPERVSGTHNAACNPYFFRRCSRLLQDLERAVIFGSQTLTHKEETVLMKRMSMDPRQSMDEMDDAQLGSELATLKKHEIAARLSRHTSDNFYDGALNGTLLFKRNTRKSSLHTKGWKQRHFVVDNRVLLCFMEPHSVNPLRTIALQSCHIEAHHLDSKYGETRFDIINYSNNNRFQLRAEDKEQRDKWVAFLRSEVSGAPQVVLDDIECSSLGPHSPSPTTTQEGDDSASLSPRKCPIIEEREMTPVQRKRFNYFKQVRVLLTNMTNICERLRFKDRTVRKFFLRRDMHDLQIPPFSYLPIAGSTGSFTQILRSLPNEGHAFSTKARCPALMIFELQVHPLGIDTASFLASEMEQYEEEQVIDRTVEVQCGSASSWENDSSTAEPASAGSADDSPIPQKTTRAIPLGEQGGTPSVWQSTGTGLVRLGARKLSSVRHSPTTPKPLPATTQCAVAGAIAWAGKAGGKSDEVVKSDDVQLDMKEEEGDGATTGTLIGETFSERATRLKASSPFGELPGWKLGGLIAKSNDDVRQEVFVMQLIRYYKTAFEDAHLPCWLYTYTILSTSQSTGLIELIPNAVSLDGLKKIEGYPGSLRAYYEQTYGFVKGKPEPPAFRAALNNYITSLSAYSVISYLLGIKDRHNGNIMIDTLGHLIHIDFGFVFGLAPGKAASMERAPWKLTWEMVEVLGGAKSPDYEEYVRQCALALGVARLHHKQVKGLMEVMTFHSSYPAFQYNNNAIRDFERRLAIDVPEKDLERLVRRLVYKSYGSTGTYLYDEFQLATNGIAV